MARKIKKPKLRLKRNQVIKKTEEDLSYHTFEELRFLDTNY